MSEHDPRTPIVPAPPEDPLELQSELPAPQPPVVDPAQPPPPDNPPPVNPVDPPQRRDI